VSGSSPPERLALGVVCGDKVINALHKLRDAGEGSAPDGLVGYQGKKSLHLIEPGTVGAMKCMCQRGLAVNQALILG
jgi:hypothetical protein